MANDPISLRRLSHFLESFLLPVSKMAESAVAGGSRYESLIACGFLVEAYDWLELGVLNDLFPADAAAASVPEHMRVTLTATDLLKDYRYLFREDLVRRLELALHDQIHFRGTGKGAIASNADFPLMFEIAARSAGSFARDPLAHEALRALVLMSEPEFASLLKSEIAPAGIADAIVGDAITAPAGGHDPEELAFAGFFCALRHMQETAALFDDAVQRAPHIDRGQWALFRIELADRQMWHLNMRNRTIETRIGQMAVRVEEILRQEARTFDTELTVGGFVAFVEDVADRWANLLKSATAPGFAN